MSTPYITLAEMSPDSNKNCDIIIMKHLYKRSKTQETVCCS